MRVAHRYHALMERFLKASLLIVLFGLAAVGIPGGAAATPAPAPIPQVDGNLIRDARTGKEFVPHGVNWPSFEYACQQGWGYANPGANPATAQAMLEWNIDTVRIPLNQDCWLGEDGLPTTSLLTLTSGGYRTAVEQFVTDLTDAGIVAILDLHWSAPPGYVANGLRPMPDSRSDEFWVSVAGRFKTNPSVIFDLFNEPHSRWDPNRPLPPPRSGKGGWDFKLTWEGWANGGQSATNHTDMEYPFTHPRYETTGMADLVAKVRSTGASQPIILSGLDYTNDLSGWADFAPGDQQLIAGFHNYPGQRCNNESCWITEVAELSTRVPVITTEIGQNDCRSNFVRNYVDWADDFHIGYLAWAWWDLELPGGSASCTNFALIDDLDGTPTPDYGAAYRQHLLSLPSELPQVKQVPKREPGLRITRASFSRGLLKVVIRIDPNATAPVSTSFRLKRNDARDGRSRVGQTKVVRFKVNPANGIGRFTRPVTGKWFPTVVSTRYPGDARLLADRSVRRIQSAASP